MNEDRKIPGFRTVDLRFYMWCSSACTNMGKNADVVNCIHGGFLWLSDEVGYDKYISWTGKKQQGFAERKVRQKRDNAQISIRYNYTFM